MAKKRTGACAQAIKAVKVAIEAAVNTSREYGGQNSAQFLHLAATFAVMADKFFMNGHHETAKACEDAASALPSARDEVIK